MQDIRKTKTQLIAELSAMRRQMEVLKKAMPLSGSEENIQGVKRTGNERRDITDCMRAEEKLKESEQRWMDIIDFLPDATFAINDCGEVIAWNHAMEDLTGIKAADMLNKGDYEYALPFYGKKRPMIIDLVLRPDKKVEKSYRLMIKEQDNILMMEALVSCLPGGNTYLWGKASRLYDGKGNIVGAIEAIRDITKHKQTEAAIRKREKELKAKKRELEDFNAALEILLKKREHDKKDLEDKIMSNVKMLILPYIEKLKESLNDSKALSHISILDANLQEIVSPFGQKLSAQYMNLTGREIQIADLIKANKSTKEISEFLNISEGAVNIHRHRIRQKLHLTKKHNLRAYFESLA